MVNAKNSNLWPTSNRVVGEKQTQKYIHLRQAPGKKKKKKRFHLSGLAPQEQFTNQTLHVITALV